MTDENADQVKIHYIYLLHRNDFFRHKEMIFKLGRTAQLNTSRLNSYLKGSVMLLQRRCENSIRSEAELLKLFRARFKPHPEHGAEYFEGDPEEMVHVINSHLSGQVGKMYADDTKAGKRCCLMM